MGKYIGKRFLSIIVTLFILSIFVFWLTHNTSGDPAAVILGSESTPEQIDALREQMGLNDPLITQYVQWFKEALQGDFGDSYFRNEPALQAVKESFIPTIEISLYAELIAVLIAIPAGIFAASRKGKMSDVVTSSINLVGLSLPNFLIALIFILFFGVKLQAFPVSGYKTIAAEGAATHFKYLIMPVAALAITQIPIIMRTTKSAMSEVLATDYIKTTKAKGLKKVKVILKHALRNSANTILTVIGQGIGSLFAGAAVIETIFTIPGMGQLIVSSVLKRDYPIIQCVIMLVGLVYIVINFIVDMLYGIVDPRIRITGRAK